MCVGVWVSVCEELCFTNQYKSEANQSLVTILSLNSRASRVRCQLLDRSAGGLMKKLLEVSVALIALTLPAWGQTQGQLDNQRRLNNDVSSDARYTGIEYPTHGIRESKPSLIMATQPGNRTVTMTAGKVIATITGSAIEIRTFIVIVVINIVHKPTVTGIATAIATTVAPTAIGIGTVIETVIVTATARVATMASRGIMATMAARGVTVVASGRDVSRLVTSVASTVTTHAGSSIAPPIIGARS